MLVREGYRDKTPRRPRCPRSRKCWLHGASTAPQPHASEVVRPVHRAALPHRRHNSYDLEPARFSPTTARTKSQPLAAPTRALEEVLAEGETVVIRADHGAGARGGGADLRKACTTSPSTHSCFAGRRSCTTATLYVRVVVLDEQALTSPPGA